MWGPQYNSPPVRWRIELEIEFLTAWRIGSGQEGETTDMGILVDPDGTPILPGSSIKGVFRSCCERLAGALGVTACLLDRDLSGVDCWNGFDSASFRQEKKAISEGKPRAVELRRRMEEKTCHVCRLFGTTMMGGRLILSDGCLTKEGWPELVERRDGVVIDRDEGVARDGLKYDYDVAPAGMNFSSTLEWIDYPRALEKEERGQTLRERALVAAAIFQWSDGFSLGGFTSRGLGRARLVVLSVKSVDFGDPEQAGKFLVKREWNLVKDWENRWQGWIEEQLATAIPGARVTA